MSGRLFIVATPIGNLEDITLRALRVLRAADVILAEDSRRTRALCIHHSVDTKVRSFHAHTPDAKMARIVAELQGTVMALVTDAGTPVVSDPGRRLVAAATDAGVPVEVIPGASAVTAALSVAGIACDTFRFVGFLPRKGPKRRALLDAIATDPSATVLFEAPTRLAATLADLAERLDAEREVAVCRELTKMHEEVVRGPIGVVRARFVDGSRGEVTLVVQGERGGAAEVDFACVDHAIARAQGDGLSARDAARRVSQETGLPKREAYRRVLAADSGGEEP